MQQVIGGGRAHLTKLALPLGLLSGVFLTQVSLAALEAPVQFASVSAPGTSDAMSLLKGGGLEARPDAQFVKLSLVFAKPVPLSRVEVEACSEEFQDGADFFFTPGFRQTFAEGGVKQLKAVIEQESGPVETLAINFRHSMPLCLKSLRLFNREGRLVSVRLPVAIVGQATAQEGTNDPASIFDARVDTPMSSDGGEISFAFEKPQTIDGLLVWVGDQRSPDLFIGRGRPQKLILSGEGGFNQEVELKDIAGAQEGRFSKPFSGQRLSMRLASTRAGIAGQRAHISELRFLQAGQPLVVATFSRGKSVESSLQGAFEQASASVVLDREFKHGKEKESWLFRLRSDGSFFIRGFSDEERVARAYSAQGSFEVVSSSAKGVRIRLHGVRRATSGAWDGANCGIACEPQGKSGEIRVQDLIEIEKSRANSFMVRNRTAKNSRSLGFSDLRVTLSSLHE